ncbi:MAG: FAD-dependent 5-carboxymethylaminomethyl-2-thiouridine(34) oxidoreductase MnmC [Alcaligenaceae bacterium]
MNTQNALTAQRAQVLRLLDLPHAWAGRESYTLLDLDDGHGLGFVMLWRQWRSDPKRCARLHVVLVAQALSLPCALRGHLLSMLPEQDHVLAEQLVKQWPLNLPGVHRLEFEALNVTLTLAVGPASVMLSRVSLTADAVLLSEAQLPEATPEQVDWAVGLGRLSKANTVFLACSTTVAWPAGFETSLIVHEQATYRLAAALRSTEQVSDRLETDQYEPGLTMPASQARTIARDTDGVRPHRSAHYWLRARVSPRSLGDAGSGASFHSASAPRHLVVVGGGLAGLHVAQALALRGWRVTVLEAGVAHAQGQSGHLAAALTPVVSRQDDPYARLSRAGSLRAQVRWAQMSDEIVTPCGALQLQRVNGRIVDLKRIADELGFPEPFVRFVDAAQASELAGMSLSRGGLYFSTARRVQPQPLMAKLAQADGITCLSARAARVERVECGGPWRVLDRTGTVLAEALQVVLAAGLATQRLLSASDLLEADSRLASMYGLGGELTYVDQALLAGGPRCIVSGDGYVLPAVKGTCVLGGSYLNDGGSCEALMLARQQNLERGAQLLNIPLQLNQPLQWPLTGWGGQRAVVPDRFPVVGPVLGSPGLWVATGFASRGLTWASLVGDLIAACLTNEPLPLENDIIARIIKN